MPFGNESIVDLTPYPTRMLDGPHEGGEISSTYEIVVIVANKYPTLFCLKGEKSQLLSEMH